MSIIETAQHYLERIEHFSKHAGIGGYSQAKCFWNKLSDLPTKALDSESTKPYIEPIQRIIEIARPLMEEMKRRQDDHGLA